MSGERERTPTDQKISERRGQGPSVIITTIALLAAFSAMYLAHQTFLLSFPPVVGVALASMIGLVVGLWFRRSLRLLVALSVANRSDSSGGFSVGVEASTRAVTMTDDDVECPECDSDNARLCIGLRRPPMWWVCPDCGNTEQL